MEKTVFVPVSSAAYNALVVRCNDTQADVLAALNAAISEYLDRTKPAPVTEPTPAVAEEVKGFQWGPVMLPNGTEIKMTYDGKDHAAVVAKEKVRYKNRYYTPSRFASLIAAKTSRNAWRDLWIKRPGDDSFRLADDIRKAS